MPNRIIREGILDSDRVTALVRDCGWQAEVFYRRLMSVADDFGRFDGRLPVLKAWCYPTLNDLVRDVDLQRWLAACEKAGLVRIYTIRSSPYGVVRDFRQQTRAKLSKFPDPPPEEGETLRTCVADAQHMRTYTDTDTKSDTSTVVSKADSNPPASVDDPEIPVSLQTPEFKAAWADWIQHKRTLKKGIRVFGAKKQLGVLEEIGPARAIKAINRSIAAGWQSINEDTFAKGSPGPRSEQPRVLQKAVMNNV